MKLIDKDDVVAEIENWKQHTLKCGYAGQREYEEGNKQGRLDTCEKFLHFIDTLEVKEVDLMIHTIIAECCDWLAMNTELSHDEIEGCRNLMLTVKDEQLKAQKGEK